MTNVNNESQKFVQEDEIDLIDLILSIWQGKWIIIASTIFATIVGVGYYLMSPTQIQANVDLQALSKEEATWLDEVSTLPGVNLNVGNVVSFYANNIKDKQFVEQFIDDYFANQVDKLGLQNLNTVEVIKVEYQFSDPPARPITGVKLTISSSVLSPSELDDFIREFLLYLQKNTRSDMIEYVQKKSDLYEASIQEQIATANLQKRVVLTQYQEQLDVNIAQIDEKITEETAITEAYLVARIQILKDHINIARKLNIERPDQGQDMLSEGSAVFNSIKAGSAPLFMRGYIALEEERSSIENRTDLEIFSKVLRDLIVKKTVLENRDETTIFAPEIVKLNGQLLKLNNDIPAANYVAFLDDDNLASFSPQIMKVTSSLSGTDFITKTSPRKIIIILAILAGGFIGIVLVFMLSVTRAVRKKLKLAKS